MIYAVFLIGLLLIGLFVWYFGAQDERQKRKAGTWLTVVVTLFSLYVFVSPRDFKLWKSLGGADRGPEGKLFGNIPLGIDLQGGSAFTVRIQPAGNNRVVDRAAQEQVREILIKRLNEYGTVDMAIIPQGENALEIQMPGVKDEDFAKVRDVITKVAKLEFRLVSQQNESILSRKKTPTEPVIEPGFQEMPYIDEVKPEIIPGSVVDPSARVLRGRVAKLEGNTFTLGDTAISISDSTKFQKVNEARKSKKDALIAAEKSELTADRWVQVEGRLVNKVVQAEKVSLVPTIIVADNVACSGKEVASAGVYMDINDFKIGLNMSDVGADKMLRTTKGNVGQRLAIVLDGEVISAPTIRDELSKRFEISGNFSQEEAFNLSSSLNNPLETPLKIDNEETVGASLGADTIKQGIIAGLVGLALICVFMMTYYRMAGLIAIVGLIINAAILFGFMAMSHSTLTMLGIAGVILTIGMAVDANVLIYERLREELQTGKGLIAALHAGYDRAFSAIFDGHMTSIITGVILFAMGSGTIKGFAVSLVIGLFASLFGSLLVTRTLFSYFPNLKKLSFLDLIKNRSFDFMGNARLWIWISIITVIITAGAWAWKRGDALGPDLRGGDQITILANESNAGLSIEELEKFAQGVDNSAVVQQKTRPGAPPFFVVRTDEGKGDSTLKALREGTKKSLDQGVSITRVGSQIGSKMLWQSLIALGVGLLGILIYMTFRFEFAFSFGAIVALVHDLICCTGWVILTGRDINLLQVGALLTIAGYSVNDTIVIFDRIREYFRQNRSGSVKEIMNDAISSTLSRTLLTAVSSLVVILCLWIFGGPAVGDFSSTLFFGILLGTYSSIFVASPIVYWYTKARNVDLQASVQEEEASRQLSDTGIEREVAPRKI